MCDSATLFCRHLLHLQVHGHQPRSIDLLEEELQRLRNELGSHAVEFGSDADSELSFGAGAPELAFPFDFTGVWVKVS